MSSDKGTVHYVPGSTESLESIAENAAARAGLLDGDVVHVTYCGQTFQTRGDEATLLQQLRAVYFAEPGAPQTQYPNPPYGGGCVR